MENQMQRPISRRMNVGETERKTSIATGLALLGYVLTKRPKAVIGLPLSLDAAYMVYRGVTGHCVVYNMLEINRSEVGAQGIRVERAVTINKPREELFRIWRNFENLGRFMQHLKYVRVDESSGGKRSHWVAKAPLGKEIEWDSEITEERENEYLAWKSLPDSIVQSGGSVRFEDAPGGRGTIVQVSMQYHPPAGSMGAAFAKLFGEEPSMQIRDDLRRFKQIMETGEIATIEGQTSGRNLMFGRSIREREREREMDQVEVSSEGSFPASDPPGWVSNERPVKKVRLP
ncbi:MAG: SRPBCC family protein [Anaerolineales bacterium]